MSRNRRCPPIRPTRSSTLSLSRRRCTASPPWRQRIRRSDPRSCPGVGSRESGCVPHHSGCKHPIHPSGPTGNPQRFRKYPLHIPAPHRGCHCTADHQASRVSAVAASCGECHPHRSWSTPTMMSRFQQRNRGELQSHSPRQARQTPPLVRCKDGYLRAQLAHQRGLRTICRCHCPGLRSCGFETADRSS